MKKILALFGFLIVGFLIFTGQTYIPDDATLVRIDIKETSPFIPLDLKRPVNNIPVFIYSPFGITSVGPNFRPYPHTATQSEVMGYCNPNVQNKVVAGWNSYGPSFYGTGFGVSTNGGVNWTGNYTLPGLSANSGDPSMAVTSDGKIFMNAIGPSSSTQVITWSTDNGVTWAPYVIAASIPSSVADKNHLGIDDKATSPYYNNLYISFTDFSQSAQPLMFVRSTNAGVNWGNTQYLSSTLGYRFQGVNIHTGPNGEVYMVWATRDAASPYTERYVGFAKSTNGGVNFSYTKEDAIAITGIRGYLKSTSIRVNSFPWMAVDKTGGPYNGYIYVTWTQKNQAPAGTDPDVCFSKSTNGGLNWTAPVRVNDDPLNNGRDQWFSNICVDQYGGINIIFYDSRNPSTNDSAEVYVARSVDGGNTWTNILVSDHRFKPKPISGLASGYQGDYIGICASGNTVYPLWCDDYSGVYQVWTAPISLGPSITHTPLGNTEQITGTRAVNATIIPAGSGINPSRTKLHYSKNSLTFTDSVLMTNTGGNNWTANITLTGAGTYRYFIRTADSLNRVATAPAGAPGSFYSFIASTDTIKPVITHTPLPNWPKLQWPATVTANVTDNIGIDSVWVRWYKNTPSTGIKHFKLLPTGGNNYSAAFNSTQAEVNIGDSIFYRIFAQDNSSLKNRDSTALYNFKIINLVNVCIGTGTTLVGYPFYTFYMDSKTHMLYLGSEIGVTGGGSITKIGFNVGAIGSPAMSGFQVRMQNTTITSLSGFVTTGTWQTVYTSNSYIPAGTGWQYITLTTPFPYNGTNLLIEICFNNSSWSSNTTVQATSVSPQRTYHQYADLSTGNGCVDPLSLTTSNPLLPNICIELTPGTGLENKTSQIPDKYELSQNYPNPFNPVTKISFAIPKQGMVSLKVYDILGREVANLVNEVKPAGYYTIDFDASNLASGVYFYRLESNGFVDVKRMML
ncbi:MAG: T9SS type A sorting domain-containing protein, partial [Ignavibacteria bacterium]|nr:T9SS type A sorting domain-containing protein [Ignavibacteria bacterium]